MKLVNFKIEEENGTYYFHWKDKSGNIVANIAIYGEGLIEFDSDNIKIGVECIGTPNMEVYMNGCSSVCVS
jgi:hypothetical protein